MFSDTQLKIIENGDSFSALAKLKFQCDRVQYVLVFSKALLNLIRQVCGSESVFQILFHSKLYSQTNTTDRQIFNQNRVVAILVDSFLIGRIKEDLRRRLLSAAIGFVTFDNSNISLIQTIFSVRKILVVHSNFGRF